MFLLFSLFILSVHSAIPSNCKTGVSATHCLECNTGYYLVVKDNTVSGIPDILCEKVPTITNCAQYDGLACVKCSDSFYLNNGACSACPSNCKNCAPISGSLKCLECQGTYSLSVDETECLDCSLSGNKEKCGICSGSTYFDVTTKTCVDCSTGCSLCTESYNCFQCATGYILNRATTTGEATENAKDTCVQLTNCKTVYEDHCEVCNDGYTLQKGKCVGCPANCKTCYLTDINAAASTAKCTTCNAGYMPKNGACVSTTTGNCAEGDANYGCLKCVDGYYFDDNYECKQCNAECATCVNSADHCLTCKSGYYFGADGDKSICKPLSDTSCKL